MSRVTGLAALATVFVFAAFTCAFAQAEGEQQLPIRDIAGPDPVIPPTIPGPIDPPPGPSGVSYEGMQLVGFTSETFAGNRGVLNMSLACGREFKHSRTCTAAEVMSTVKTPEAPAHLDLQLAWVQASGAAQFVDLYNGRVSDCMGWASASSRTLGLAIEVGLEEGCYGGFTAQTCDQELVVACCALVKE